MKRLFLTFSLLLIVLISYAQDYSKIYLVGPATSAAWDANAAIPMTLVPGSNAIYTWTGTLKGGEFKFINARGSWSNSFTAAGDGFLELNQTYALLFNNASDKKFLVSTPGLYTLTVDMRKLTMTYASAAPAIGLSFNGTTSSYIDLATTATAPAQFTVEAWVFYRSFPTGDGAYILSTEEAGAAGSQGFSLRTNNNKIQLCIGNGNWVSVNGATTLEIGAWYHIAATCSNTNIKVYINGVQDATATISTGMIASTKNLRIGDSPSWNGRLLNGVISDLRFWNVVRSANDIATNNTKMLTGNEVGLLANWKMTEGTGTNIADLSNRYGTTKPADVAWFNGIPQPLAFTSSTFTSNNKDIETAYNLAVKIVANNVHGGILAAGAEYNAGWTRDCAINNMFGVSLVNPTVAKASMWNVTNNKNTIGAEYWDRIIWVLAALDYYKVTGDTEFLQQAYTCSANSIKIQEDNYFDSAYGLFKGPSVFNDGISGYPQPVYDPTISSGAADSHPNTKLIKCLSTNSVYYGAYMALIEMGQILKVDNNTLQGYQTRGDAVKANILKYLYSEADNKLNYLIDNNGNIAKYQEGLGLTFATILGVLTPTQAKKVINNASFASTYGITSIYPDFSDYSPAKPGRHNNIIWPHVNAYFAEAAMAVGDTIAYKRELFGITHLAIDADKGNFDFCEIYNPYTGVPDGGWQVGGHWNKITRQTWAATGYMHMVYNGLFGMHFQANGIYFTPYLPETINRIELKNIAYRQATLNILVTGKGSKIKSFTINGQKQTEYRIPTTIQGVNNIVIELDNVANLPGIVEAEQFTNMSGIQIESNTLASGGKDVGYIEAGDYLEYEANITTAGKYTITYRVEGTSIGSVSFQQNGQTLATTSLPSTGGWQTWQDVSTTVTLSAGTQTIKLLANASGFNIDKWSAEIDTSLSITQSNAEAITIHPNPATNQITINSGREQIDHFSIIDNLGRVVLEKGCVKANHTTIDVSKLPRGIYILVIITDSRERCIKKFVK
jgi:hypothetical protein